MNGQIANKLFFLSHVCFPLLDLIDRPDVFAT
jgi:hypothetical protein